MEAYSSQLVASYKSGPATRWLLKILLPILFSVVVSCRCSCAEAGAGAAESGPVPHVLNCMLLDYLLTLVFSFFKTWSCGGSCSEAARSQEFDLGMEAFHP